MDSMLFLSVLPHRDVAGDSISCVKQNSVKLDLIKWSFKEGLLPRDSISHITEASKTIGGIISAL